jgi:hypothetical protein
MVNILKKIYPLLFNATTVKSMLQKPHITMFIPRMIKR